MLSDSNKVNFNLHVSDSKEITIYLVGNLPENFNLPDRTVDEFHGTEILIYQCLLSDGRRIRPWTVVHKQLIMLVINRFSNATQTLCERF